MHFSKQRPLSFQILCQKCVRGVLRIVVVQIKWKLRNWSHACTAYSGFAKRSIANQTQHIDKCLEILRKTKETYGQKTRSPLKTDEKLNIFEGRRRELRTPAGNTTTNQRKSKCKAKITRGKWEGRQAVTNKKAKGTRPMAREHLNKPKGYINWQQRM